MASSMWYVSVRLRVNLSPEDIKEACLQDGKSFVAVSGPDSQLGYGNSACAPRMTYTGRNTWTKALRVRKDSELKYKYLIKQRDTNEVLHSENIATREVYVHSLPLIIDNVYNREQLIFTGRRIDPASQKYNYVRRRKPETPKVASVSKDDRVDREIENCQRDDDEKELKFRKYAEHMKIAAKIGLAAVAVFGVYKVVLKRSMIGK